MKSEKEYREQVVTVPGKQNEGMGLTLKPNHSAMLTEHGSAPVRGSYNIKGKKLIVKIQDVKEYIFTVISEQEIHAETGQRLFLVQP